MFAFNINSFSNALSLSLFQREVYSNELSGTLYALLELHNCKKHVIINTYFIVWRPAPFSIVSKSVWLTIGVMPSKCPEPTECRPIGFSFTVENVFLELC